MSQYSFKVKYTDQKWLTDAGYGRVAHLPFIVDHRPGYHRTGSQYLIDRGLGIWAGGKPGTEVRPPTSRSLRSYAAWLCNFLEWSQKRGVDLFSADYAEHIYGRYQRELLAGIWSRDGQGLSETTVNLYVDTAVDFLVWLAAKKERPPFVVPVITRTTSRGSASSSVSHRLNATEVRQGKVRQAPRTLRMPSDSELDCWLTSVYAKNGLTFGLMCETVIDTAIRREEACCWRIDTLPLNPKDWVIANPTAESLDKQVMVTLRYGTKGPEYGFDHGDKIGPKRIIKIPLRLADKLHSYRIKVRPVLLAKRVTQVRGAAAQRKIRDDAVHLFLSPEGNRESASRFYEAWKSGQLPFPEWSPHLGRHWWSCSTLMQEIRGSELFSETSHPMPGVLIVSLLTDVIRMKITPQLGHASSKTAQLYMQWAIDQTGIALPERFQAAMLDEETPITEKTLQNDHSKI